MSEPAFLVRRIKRRESTCPRHVVTPSRQQGESRVRELGAALVCRQKLLFPYKAPLSRTILLEWLRKTPNRGEPGIAVSNAAVSSDRRGKNSFATLGLVASAPPPFPQRCDCAAKLWLLFLLASVSSLHRPSVPRAERSSSRVPLEQGQRHVSMPREREREGAEGGEDQRNIRYRKFYQMTLDFVTLTFGGCFSAETLMTDLCSWHDTSASRLCRPLVRNVHCKDNRCLIVWHWLDDLSRVCGNP